MMFHENRLLADDSHEISYLISSKIRKNITKLVVCCSRDWCFSINYLTCSWHLFTEQFYLDVTKVCMKSDRL